jgi:hypothetical protein
MLQPLAIATADAELFVSISDVPDGLHDFCY